MGYEINFASAQVKSTISSMDGVYDQISAVITDIKNKEESIASFWSCTEANNFKTVLASVATDFDNFEKKYDAFKTALNQVITTYENDDEAFSSKLDSMAKVNGSPSYSDSGNSSSSAN
jgi:uncharacterized protein YukE